MPAGASATMLTVPDHGIDTSHLEHWKLPVAGSMQIKPFGT